MATLRIDSGDHVSLSTWEKVGALKGDMAVPVTSIERVDYVPSVGAGRHKGFERSAPAFPAQFPWPLEGSRVEVVRRRISQRARICDLASQRPYDQLVITSPPVPELDAIASPVCDLEGRQRSRSELFVTCIDADPPRRRTIGGIMLSAPDADLTWEVRWCRIFRHAWRSHVNFDYWIDFFVAWLDREPRGSAGYMNFVIGVSSTCAGGSFPFFPTSPKHTSTLLRRRHRNASLIWMRSAAFCLHLWWSTFRSYYSCSPAVAAVLLLFVNVVVRALPVVSSSGGIGTIGAFSPPSRAKSSKAISVAMKV